MSVNHFCTIEREGTGSYLQPLPKTATIFQRLGRRFRESLMVSKNDPASIQYFHGTTGCLKERTRHVTCAHWYIIHPMSDFKLFHEILLSISLFFTFMLYPFYISFLASPSGIQSWYVLADYTLSIIFTIDIIIRFFIGVEIIENQEVSLNQKDIAKKYVLGIYFIPDILSSVPTTIFYSYFDYKSCRVIDLLKFFKFVRLKSFFKYVRHILERVNLGTILSQIINGGLLTVLIFHWASCLQYGCPYVRDFFTNNLGEKSWVIDEHYISQKDPGHMYLMSLHRAASLLFGARSLYVEDGNIEEIWLCTITIAVGKIFILTLGVIGVSLMIDQWSLETKYLAIMSQLNEFMRIKKLPLPMRERVVSYFEYKFQHKYFREISITSMLSDKLKREINIQLSNQLINQAALFADLPLSVQSNLLTHLKDEVYLPNDIIIKAGTNGDCMYFLSSGTVSITSPSGKEVCHLEDGSYFGEIALLSKDSKRIANVIALEICVVLRLDRKVFKTCFKKNSEYLKQLQTTAELRLQKTAELEELLKQQIFHQSYNIHPTRSNSVTGTDRSGSY